MNEINKILQKMLFGRLDFSGYSQDDIGLIYSKIDSFDYFYDSYKERDDKSSNIMKEYNEKRVKKRKRESGVVKRRDGF